MLRMAEQLQLAQQPLYIGRRSLFDEVDALFSARRALLVACAEGDFRRLGATRLLREIGFRLLHDGHVPLLLAPRAHPTAPHSLRQVAAQVLQAVVDTCERLSLPAPPLETVACAAPSGHAQSAVRRGLRKAIAAFSASSDPLDVDDLRESLAEDLSSFALTAQSLGEPFGPHTRAVVLAEGLHLWDGALGWIAGRPPGLLDLLTPSGLGPPERPAPVIATTAESVELGLFKAERAGMAAYRFVPLAALPEDEATLGYQWVLLQPWHEQDRYKKVWVAAPRPRQGDAARGVQHAGGASRHGRLRALPGRARPGLGEDLPLPRRRGGLAGLRRAEQARAVTGLQEELERLRAQRFAAYPAATLAALALLPRWTDTLARTAELGAVPEELVESTMLLLDDGGQERAFWVRESVRAELGAYLRREHADTLRRALRRLTGLLYRVDHDWFTVADVHEKDPTGLRLLREVSDRVEAGRLPEAARLVATAEALADVLGGHLTGSARRAAWRLARATREAEDAHRLRHYQRRDEIEEEMLVGPSWAVHLLGSGGAGKTMLVRRLATRVTTARVDFDHLDPRYPESRPGEMFTALAVDLLGWVGSRAGEAAYRRFLDAVEELHEELARPYRLESRTEPLLDRMVAAFAGLLTSLDQEVTLVLDTCEELAKLYPPGEPAPGIDMTFALLERLHALVPSLRVVLAGRRWLVPPPSGAPSGPLLRPRPYLRVLPVGGFTRAEAERYLTARGLPPRFTPAVLSRAAGENGYNPFDLAVHADWVLAEPSLDPASLVTDPGDPYIERRVIGRLRDPALVRCLGVAAELGTLDRALAAAEFAALGVEADAVFGELAAQEWARVRAHTPDGRPSVVELEAQLCARLRAVTSADPDRFPLHGRRLGRTAAELVRGVESIAEAPVATLLAALRLLPSGEALALWAEVEARVVAERAWGWAEHVTARAAADLTDTADRLLSHPSPFSPERSDSPSPDRRSEGRRSEDRRSGGDRRAGVLAGVREVLAAVLSTQAATRVQTGGGGVAALWWHVLRFGNAVQRDRALLGLVSAGEGDIDFPAELRRIVATGTNLAAPDAETGAEADEGTKSTVRTPAGSTVGVLAGSIAAAADRWMIEGRWSDLRAADLLAVAEAGVDPRRPFSSLRPGRPPRAGRGGADS
ncbi:hypothetical protein GCM10020219_043590 [Nonomuraea dietziae]